MLNQLYDLIPIPIPILIVLIQYCKGGVLLLLYEAPISLERWRTSPRHVRKYGYGAQPASHVCTRCCTTSMYIDPSFAQLLASFLRIIHSVERGTLEVHVGGISPT